MQAMILAGGFGTRISEESNIRPKPMVEIGNYPILWHIMKIYSHYGINDFVVCCGYKGHMIKEWFTTYQLRHADISVDLRSGKTEIHNNGIEPWRITLVDTGENSMTGGRIKRALDYIEGDTFCLTYGDGVSNIDVSQSVAFHKEHERLVTMTAVQPEGRFGAFTLAEGAPWVTSFKEKPKGDGAWVNGGFFVLNKKIGDYIEGDASVWEEEPLQSLATAGQVAAYRHADFWMPMDTIRDRNVLEALWKSDNPPWKVW